MAKCKVCRTSIPDGKEYCSNCQDKEQLVSNESYLDSLLNSVKNTAQTAESIYKKRKGSSDLGIKPNSITNEETDLADLEESELEDDMSYPLDLDDINDFDQYSLDDDLFDGEKDTISDEDLFGDDLSNLLSADDYDIDDQRASEPISLDNAAQFEEHHVETQKFYEDEINEYQPSESISEMAATLELMPPEVGQDDKFLNEMEDASYGNFNSNSEEYTEYEAEDDFDPDLNDLLNSLDHFETSPMEKEQTEELNATMQQVSDPDYEEYEQNEAEDDDFLALLNQISSDDPVVEDVKAINSMLGGTPVKPQSKSGMPSDVGEVFSDALRVVSSLNDGDINEAELLENISDVKGKKKKQKKAKKSSNKNIEDDDTENIPKVGWIKRLFGNVKDENAAKMEQLKKEQSEKQKASKKEAKKVKTPKGKKAIAATSEDEDQDYDNSSGKDTNSKDKKNKKDKPKKQKEVIRIIDEIEEDEGRINRLGAFIVFVFFGLLALLLYVGSNVVTYTLSIQNATTYFDHKKYTQAYNEVYGIDIKDEDIEIYDKIMTVMFVNKQLNSYNNYYTIGKYPEALDSLLKGLKRYDKYIELATMLGIRTDMDYVREQILAELESVFKLSEEDAMKINIYENMSDYSMEVYDIVFENMKN